MAAMKTPSSTPIRGRRHHKLALLAGSMLALFAVGPGVSAAGAAPRPPQEFPMKIRMDAMDVTSSQPSTTPRLPAISPPCYRCR
jgi:hypothetical protein